MGATGALRIYRRILAVEAQAAAEQVRDVPGLLRVLQSGLERVPAEELGRELSLMAASGDHPLACFAEGIVDWLTTGNVQAAERAGRALTGSWSAECVDALAAFAEGQAGERGAELMAAMLTSAPLDAREVLRRAPRFSPAYRQALLRMGAGLLAAFESEKEAS
jgi:hypothetical protein